MNFGKVSSIGGKILDSIGISEEKTEAVAAVPPQSPTVPVQPFSPSLASPWSPSRVVAVQPPPLSPLPVDQKDQRYYPTLLSKTSPNASITPSLDKVLQFEKRLVSIIADRTTRMKAAIAQADVTVDSITSEIQKLGELLVGEGQTFQQEVARKQSELDQKQSQATTLEQQLHDLRVEISDKKNKMDQASVEFQGAYAHREAEIKQLQSESTNWR